jgi:multidrug resistance efflux pump
MALIETPDLGSRCSGPGMLEQSKSALHEAQAALEQATANAKLAGITQALGTLQEHGAVSKQRERYLPNCLQLQSCKRGIASANVAAARNNVASNQANLERYLDLQSFEQVRAPFTGVVTVRNVDVGALITSNTTLLFRIGKWTSFAYTLTCRKFRTYGQGWPTGDAFCC